MTTRTNNFEDSQTLNDERLRDFAEAASDWFFEMDSELRFTYVSARHQQQRQSRV